MQEKKLFIFDLDGTLVDAYRAIEKSVNFTLVRLGYPPASYAEVKRRVGRGDRMLIMQFIRKKDGDRAMAIYRPHHRKTLPAYTRLRPGARKTLSILKRRKKLIAIASNRPRAFTDVILKKLNLKRYLEFVLCADEINSRKPRPKIINLIRRRFRAEKSETVYVGDMDIDLETARRAGVDAVFIRGGSSPLSAAKRYRRKKVISSPAELLTLYR